MGNAFESYQRGGEPQPGLLSAEAFGRSPAFADDPGVVFANRARLLVFNYVMNRLDKTDKTHETFTPDEVFVVWFCKTLKNWKALVSTTLPDGMYYEVTHNGEKSETYVDAYRKFDNICVPDSPAE